jgi:hypothetical protein
VTQTDLFGGAPNPNPVVGLSAKLPDRPCRQCGSTDATIESTGHGPHHGSLRCGCGEFRGWLSKETYTFVTATIQKFGKLTEPIIIQRGAKHD